MSLAYLLICSILEVHDGIHKPLVFTYVRTYSFVFDLQNDD